LVYNQILQGDYKKCEKWESVMYMTSWRVYRMPGNGWKPF
jgi:hypothetical protein